MMEFRLRIVAVMLVLILACGPAGLAGAERVELKVAGQEYTYSKAAMQVFREKYPDINLVEEYGYLSMDDGTLQAVLQAGDAAPDILLVSSGPSRVGVLAQHGLILPISDLLAKNDVLSRYQGWVTELIKQQDAQGRVFEVVEGVDVFQMYYNKAIFVECGVEAIPETWEDFLAVCQKIKDKGYQPIAAGFNQNLQAGWFGGLLVESAAGSERMTEAIFGEGRFDTSEFQLAGDMLRELIDMGYLDATEVLALDYTQALTPFYSGNAAMCPLPQNRLLTAIADSTIPDDGGFGAFPLPSRETGRPSRPTAGLATSWIVNSEIQVEKLDAVALFLDFISSQAYLEIAMKNGGSVIPVLNEMPAGLEMSEYFTDAFEKLENGAGYNPSVYLPANAKTQWFETLQGITAGELTPEEGMALLQEAMEVDRESR